MVGTTSIVIILLLTFKRGLLWTKQEAAGQVFRNPKDLPHGILKRLDAVLILGGGVPKSLEEPPVYVQRRCDDAAAIVKRYQEEVNQHYHLPILCLSAGSAHVPQLMSADGLPIWESTSSAAYLKKTHGIEANVYVETTSYDTIGNAYYARTSHTDVNGWRRLLIVTNEVRTCIHSELQNNTDIVGVLTNIFYLAQFHMERTKEIFVWIFGMAGNNKYERNYLSSDNVGLTDTGLHVRQEHEARGAKNVRQNLVPQLQTLNDVWMFLNQQHGLYAAAKLSYRAQTTGQRKSSDASLKESYGADA